MRFLQPFTHDVGLLEPAIASTSAHGDTALFSTLYVVLKEFARAGENATEVRRPAIVVLTDGEDNASLVGQDDVIELVRRTGVAIYPISIVSAVEARNPDAEGKNRTFNPIDDDLRRLARESGGQAFFPLHLGELDSVYAWVARELAGLHAERAGSDRGFPQAHSPGGLARGRVPAHQAGLHRRAIGPGRG